MRFFDCFHRKAMYTGTRSLVSLRRLVSLISIFLHKAFEVLVMVVNIDPYSTLYQKPVAHKISNIVHQPNISQVQVDTIFINKLCTSIP